MNDLAVVIGNAAASRTRRELLRGGPGSILKVSELLDDEILSFVRELKGFNFDRAADPIRILVGVRQKHEFQALPNEFRLPENATPTSYRNVHGLTLVFVERDTLSDAQSVGELSSITDRSILEDGADGRRDVIRAAWAAHAAAQSTPPAELERMTDEVWETLNSLDSIAVRSWAEFCLHCCADVAKSGRAADAGTVGRAIGSALPVLRLFRDQDLFERTTAVQRSRRLRRNYLFARDQDAREKPIDRDEVAAVLDRIEFLDETDHPYPLPRQQTLHDDVVARLDRTHRTRLPVIDLFIWEQLFAETQRRRGLGTRIRDHLIEGEPDRVPEYDALDVREALDAREQEAARKLLATEDSEGDEAALISILPNRLRRAVERLAEPRAPAVDDPLLHLIRQLFQIGQESETPEQQTLYLEHQRSQRRNDLKSLRLFAFLYGGALQDAFDGSEGAMRFHVKVDELLIKQPTRSEGHDEVQEGDGTDPLEGWDPVEISLRWDDEQVPLHRFQWEPLSHVGLVAFRALLRQGNLARWLTGGDMFDYWCRRALEGALPGGAVVDETIAGGPVERWLELRAATFDALQQGLRTDKLAEYVTAWQDLLEEVAQEHVPHAGPLPEIKAFLQVDTLDGVPGHKIVLATHPMRLRWLVRHLGQCTRMLVSVCDGDFRINSVNEGMYFSLLDQLSPHEQPPILTVGDEMFLAVREQDWHEHFARLRDRTTNYPDWLSDLDNLSIEELAFAVDEYIVAHPHKQDGISLLFLVREGGSRVVGHLLSRTLRARRQRLGVVLHIVAPLSEFAELEKTLADLDDPEERANTDLPSLEVVLYRWPDGEQLPPLDQVTAEVDLAVVPNLFGVATNPMDSSMPARHERGGFEPWGDATSYLDSSGADEAEVVPNVSRILLPDRPDSVLRDWSTINVRQQRGRSVGTEVQSVDYVTMQVQFHQGAVMYDRLHSIAHWVVTLDAFVGREQIEALETRPDVILMRPRVGKNQAYNLVVSSKTGRMFIENRIRVRLEADLGSVLGSAIGELPGKLYDRARQLFPGLVLRCLGVGWAVQELVGLVIAHCLIEDQIPAEPAEGFVAWVSLDEQHRWFGQGRSRADLARITAHRAEEELVLDVLVVESKFREADSVTGAERQVKVSLALLKDALANEDDDEPFADARFWRRQILDAIEQSSRRSRDDSGAVALRCWGRDGAPTQRIPSDIRGLWLDGMIRVRTLRGIICTMSPSLRTHQAGELSSPSEGYKWHRLGGQEIAQVLRSLAHPVPVARRASAEAGDGGPGEQVDGHDAFVGVDDSATSAAERRTTGFSADRGEAAPVRRGSEKTPEELEALYQIVLDVFGEFNVRVQRPDEDAINEGPAFYVFRVKPGPGIKPEAIIRLTPELKLNLHLERGFQPLSYIDSGSVVFEVPKREENRYFVDAEDMWMRTQFSSDRLYAPLGADIRGSIVGIDFSSSDSPHLLIAGLTGSGKSVALETILQGLCRSHPPERLRLALVDPKGTELNDFEDDQHLLGKIGYEPEEAIERLDEAVSEMQRRRALFREVRSRSLPEYNSKVGAEAVLPWHVIVLDEFADLTADRDDRRSIEQLLQRLSQKARASGIHVIVATQKPSAEVISTTVRSNLPAQLALRVKTVSDSRIIMDEGGAEALAGMGDALFKTARRTVRLQCAAVARG